MHRYRRRCDARVGHRAGDGRQVLHQVAQGQFAGLLNCRMVDGDDRIGRFDIDTADVGTRHHNGVEGLTFLVIGTGVLRIRSNRTAAATAPSDNARRTADDNLFTSSLITLSNVRVVYNRFGTSIPSVE